MFIGALFLIANQTKLKQEQGQQMEITTEKRDSLFNR